MKCTLKMEVVLLVSPRTNSQDELFKQLKDQFATDNMLRKSKTFRGLHFTRCVSQSFSKTLSNAIFSIELLDRAFKVCLTLLISSNLVFHQSSGEFFRTSGSKRHTIELCIVISKSVNWIALNKIAIVLTARSLKLLNLLCYEMRLYVVRAKATKFL